MTRKKPTYTTKVHARRLLQMLNRPNICSLCPARKGFVNGRREYKLDADYTSTICPICQAFVGVQNVSICPCHHDYELNLVKTLKRSAANALKRTWIALEAGGFLE